jgi:hypothetical protein
MTAGDSRGSDLAPVTEARPRRAKGQAQIRQIGEMKALIADLERNPAPSNPP